MAIFSPSESPAIVVKEVDLTGGVPNVQSTTGAFAGAFRWGPVEQAKLIDNEASLASTFGAPDDTHAVDFLTAASFLRYSNALQTVRVVSSDALNSSSVDSAGLASLIKNQNAFDQNTSLVTDAIYAKYPGAIGNSIKVAWTGSGNWSAWTASYKSQFNGAPSGTERHVLVIDVDGIITGTAGTVLERFPYVNASSSAFNADGSSNYVKDVVNRNSNYINLNGTLSSSDSATLAFGANGTAPSAANYLTGLTAFEDKDTIQVDFLIAPGKALLADQDTIVETLVTTAGTTRKDCVVITSPSRASVVGVADPVTATVTETDGYPFSSYLFIDNNWLKVYDKYNDKYIYIPAAGSTAGIMAASDTNSAPWFSPAGSRRGGYLGVASLAYTPTKSQRDVLYKAGVNPVANLPGQGVLLFGDKTHLNRPSAFDRINVRRLFNVIERAIALAARNTLFELNDEFTRAEFVNIVEPFLREIKGRRGITDFRVVCDESNNTGAVVDRNEFIANIFIKPARSINYITLNFVAVRSGIDFEEVAGLSV